MTISAMDRSHLGFLLSLVYAFDSDELNWAIIDTMTINDDISEKMEFFAFSELDVENQLRLNVSNRLDKHLNYT